MINDNIIYFCVFLLSSGSNPAALSSVFLRSNQILAQNSRSSISLSAATVDEDTQRRARLRELLHRGICNGKYRLDRMVCTACLAPMRHETQDTDNAAPSPLSQLSAKLVAYRQVVISAITTNSQVLDGIDLEGQSLKNATGAQSSTAPDDGAGVPSCSDRPNELDDGTVAVEPVDAPSGLDPKSTPLGCLSQSPTKSKILHSSGAESVDTPASSRPIRVMCPRGLHLSEAVKQKMHQQLTESSHAHVALERLTRVPRGCRFYPSDSWSSTAHFYQVEMEAKRPLEHFFRTLASRSLYTQTTGGLLMQTMAPCRTLARYHRSYIPAEPVADAPQVIFMENVNDDVSLSSEAESSHSLFDQLDTSDLPTSAITAAPLPPTLELANPDESDSNLLLSRTPVLSSRGSFSRKSNRRFASKSNSREPSRERPLRKRRRGTAALPFSQTLDSVSVSSLPPDDGSPKRQRADADSSSDVESTSDLAADRAPLSKPPVTSVNLQLPVAPANAQPIPPGEQHASN